MITNFMESSFPGLAIRRRLLPLVHPVVAKHLRHPQPVVGEDRSPAGGLHAAMLFELAPLRHRFLIPPEREGEDLSGRGQALEALDRDESVAVVEQRAQRGGGVEVRILLPGVWHDFENDGDHAGSTFSRNVLQRRRAGFFSVVSGRACCATHSTTSHALRMPTPTNSSIATAIA